MSEVTDMSLIAAHAPVRPASATMHHHDLQAAAIVKSFNTWRFKREQPSDNALLCANVAKAVALHEPVRFVLYWGKGPRAQIAAPDHNCLGYLAAFSAAIAREYVNGARMVLIFTDTHARLNGHSDDHQHRYFSAVAEAATRHGFSHTYLSLVLRESGVSSVVDDNVEIPLEFREQLLRSADRWYRGCDSSSAGALAYYRQNMSERRAVESVYPHAIFVTFNGSDARMLFPPSLPVFYMYAQRKGCAVKPWFVDADETMTGVEPRQIA